MQFKFRLAGEKDIPRLTEIRTAYLSEEHKGLSEEQARAIKAQLPDYFNRHLGRDLLVFVCEDGDKIVSSVFLLITEKPAHPHIITGLTGTVLNVYTLPEYRRRGLAGSLLEMAIEEARRRELSFLELKATKAGFSLYRKLGFVINESEYTPMKYRIVEA